MLFLFETHATMKDYNAAKWWIDRDYIPTKKINANNLKEAIKQYADFNEAIWYAEHSKNGLTLSNVIDWLKVNNDGFISPRNILAVEHYVDAVIINKKRTETGRA